MNFPQNFLDELRNRTAIAEIVARTVKLTRKGREFSGLCPFHSEKSPSFTVSEEKGFYHCFGCGAHGDVIKFVMQTQNLSFVDTVTQLAERAGLPLPVNTQPQNPEQQNFQKQLIAVMQQAHQFYMQNLNDPKIGKEARDYLLKRGLTAQTIQQFGIGLALDDRDGIRKKMIQAGVTENLLIASGLVIKSDDRANYDRFRNRIMFPIPNLKQQPIGFGGRILGQGEPKYLNSPETELFHKGHVVYALPWATAAMGKNREAIVVEGYMDTIALHQAGIQNAVATLGTALTEQHLQTLWRYADKILLCFDGDAAGQRAAARSIERILPLLRTGKEVRFITIPPGFDPDTYIQAKGKAGFLALAAQAMPFYERLLDVEMQAKSMDSPEAVTDLLARIRKHLSAIQDKALYQQYRNFIWQKLEPIIQSRPKQKFLRKKIPANRILTNIKQSDVTRKESEALLVACILYPKLLASYSEDLGTIALLDNDLDLLRQELVSISHQDGLQEAETCLDFLTDPLRGKAQKICEKIRPLYKWLQQDDQKLIEHWQLLLSAFRYAQDHPPEEIVMDQLMSEQGWNEFVQKQQAQMEATEEWQTSLLGGKNG